MSWLPIFVMVTFTLNCSTLLALLRGPPGIAWGCCTLEEETERRSRNINLEIAYHLLVGRWRVLQNPSGANLWEEVLVGCLSCCCSFETFNAITIVTHLEQLIQLQARLKKQRAGHSAGQPVGSGLAVGQRPRKTWQNCSSCCQSQTLVQSGPAETDWPGLLRFESGSH